MVCEANRTRSPLAAALLARELAARGATGVTVSSAGIRARGGEPARSTVRTLAAEHGLDLSAHVSRPLAAELVAGAGLILAMTRDQADHVGMHHPGVVDRLFLLGELAALLDGADGADGAAGADRDGLLDTARAGRLRRGLADDDIADPGTDIGLTLDLLARLTAACATVAPHLGSDLG